MEMYHCNQHNSVPSLCSGLLKTVKLGSWNWPLQGMKLWPSRPESAVCRTLKLIAITNYQIDRVALWLNLKREKDIRLTRLSKTLQLLSVAQSLPTQPMAQQAWNCCTNGISANKLYILASHLLVRSFGKSRLPKTEWYNVQSSWDSQFTS